MSDLTHRSSLPGWKRALYAWLAVWPLAFVVMMVDALLSDGTWMPFVVCMIYALWTMPWVVDGRTWGDAWRVWRKRQSV